MPSLSRTVEIAAPPAFAHLDDIRHVGEHMAKGSLPLLGDRLTLEIVSPAPSGVGARYRHYSARCLRSIIDGARRALGTSQTAVAR